MAAGGFVVRNWDSIPILAGAMKFSSVSINVAEALALREALIWAKRRNWRHVWVEGDSKLVLDAICGACDVPWNLKPVIEDIKSCANSFQGIRWSHIFREANFIADALASISLNSSNLCIWEACLPIDAHLPFQFDCEVTSSERGYIRWSSSATIALLLGTRQSPSDFTG
ncbi:uncharacterized protein LOC126590273 [Malus sylvestris]|uniref:uncharacterized protein LOC126590273 n=1 Tax=Malus sylvestris TaxID=3752 RepID=UPI0021ACD534|nr:uncharacterized protein LOC126590273 [Malus sylvestris]